MQACTDCVQLICNGETPPEMSERATDEWIAKIEKKWGRLQTHLTIGEELGFCHPPCDHCGSPLAGDMHELILIDTPESRQINQDQLEAL